jgi:hypothetical protein
MEGGLGIRNYTKENFNMEGGLGIRNYKKERGLGNKEFE